MFKITDRFRHFLPVVVDVETGGLHPEKDALLELAAVSLLMDESGLLQPDKTYHYHILPEEGTVLNQSALEFNKIDPTHPLRFAIPESEAMKSLGHDIKNECKTKSCQRAVLIGHNSWFDQQFLNAAFNRHNINNPFHRFTSFDTATLAGLFFGHTVLSKAMEFAGIPFKADEAHSALYDASMTAQLFCFMVNRFKDLGGWPL